jgi:hypothetical protein
MKLSIACAILFGVLRRAEAQVVTSSLTFCDTACQAAQRSGLFAYYNSLNGKNLQLSMEYR